MVTVLFAEVVVKDGEVTGSKFWVPVVLATAATLPACVAWASPKTLTMLSAPPDNARLVIVTTVSLVRVNIPLPRARALESVPEKPKSIAEKVPVLNVPPVRVIVTVLLAEEVVKTGDVTVSRIDSNTADHSPGEACASPKIVMTLRAYDPDKFKLEIYIFRSSIRVKVPAAIAAASGPVKEKSLAEKIPSLKYTPLTVIRIKLLRELVTKDEEGIL